jgi:hypothetical protein
MARKRYKAEEIVTKLRQVDVLTSQDMPGHRQPHAGSPWWRTIPPRGVC